MPLLLLVAPTVIVFVAAVMLLAEWRATGTDLDRLFATLPSSEAAPPHSVRNPDRPMIHHAVRRAAPLTR